MRPDIWGPSAWIFLHSITLNYPENPTDIEKQNMKDFINSMGKVLPCDKCKNNFISHMQKNKLTNEILSSKKQFIKWMIDLHNLVNEINNKQKMTYEEALSDILIKTNGNNSYSVIPCYILTLLMIILLVFYYIFNR